jgi:hypothetical protein
VPCHWQNVPGFGMVHFNIAAPRKRRCAHCDCRDAKALCDWPMDKLTKFDSPGDLAAGDFLGTGEGWRARILAIDGPGPAHGYYIVRVAVLNLHGGNKTTPPFESEIALSSNFARRLLVERPGTCDKPCCSACRRHVGPDRDYCRDHWDLQAPNPGDVITRAAVPPGVRIRSGRPLDRAKQRRVFV